MRARTRTEGFMSAYLWITLVCVAILALFAVAYIAYASEVAIAHARIEAREVAALSAAGDLIGDTLQSVNRDLLFLLDTETLRSAINDETPASKQLLSEEWLSYSRSKGIYDKIRWLDEHGKERVRINNNSGTPCVVPEDRLQSRALRYFFQDALPLSPYEIYISPLDLNVEGEAIEFPYKPTLRIGTPLFGKDGERRGVLLLNYLGSDLFARIAQAAADIAPRLWLINAQGYWLRSTTPSDEWGFMRDRPDLTLANRHPMAWQKITSAVSGQFLDDEGLWSFDTLYPVQDGQISSAGSSRIFSPSRDYSTRNQYFWKVVTFISSSNYHLVARSQAPHQSLAQLGQSFIRFWQRSRKAVIATFGKVGASQQDHLAAQVFEHTHEGVMILDAQTRIVMTNRAFTQITGYGQAEVMGRTPHFLRSGHLDEDFYKAKWAKILLTGEWQGEVWSRRKNGEVFAEWLTISTIPGTINAEPHYIGVFSDITQVKQTAERMEYFAHHDTLTGLPNRRLLTARLEHNIQLAQREGRSFALLFMDLDHFKSVNDQLGHQAGDELLKEVALRLGKTLRAEDTLARLGGDEFVILLENSGNHAHITRVSDAIMEQFPCCLNTATGSINVTVSMGISLYPRDGETAATLLGSADHAMYRAKHSGRNHALMADLIDHAAADEEGKL